MREFITNYRSDFSLNAKQTLANTQASTVQSYLARFQGITGLLPNRNLYGKLDEKIAQIRRKRIDGKIKSNTVRQYKASLCFGLSLVAYEEEYGISPLIKASLTYKEANELYDKMVAITNDETAKLITSRDIKAHAEANTSTMKLKAVPSGFIEAFTEICKLPNDYRYAKESLKFLQANVIVGLRPAEWFDTQILSIDELELTEHFKKQKDITAKVFLGEDIQTGEIYLCLKNFKNSQGRACGDYRYICLDHLSQRELGLITDWIKLSNSYVESLGIFSPNDYYKRFMTKLQDTIRYIENNEPSLAKILQANFVKRRADYNANQKKANAKMKLYRGKPPIKQQVSLYSTRHQAVANAKFAGFSDLQIAAIFGHSSTSTARRHYGKVGSASGRSKLSPHPINMKQVVLKSNLIERQAKLVKEVAPNPSIKQNNGPSPFE